MQFLSTPVSAEPDLKTLPPDFPVSCMRWTQDSTEDSRFHFHNCLELGLCLKGSGVEIIDNRACSFSAGTLSVIHRGCPHDSHIPLRSGDAVQSEWLFVFADLRTLDIPCSEGCGTISSNPALVALFRIVCDEAGQKRPHYRTAVRSLLTALVGIADREMPGRQDGSFGDACPEIGGAVRYILHSYYEPVTVGLLAKKCNLSVSTLCRLFAKHVGVSPMRFVTRTRLTVARHMAETSDLSILEISESVGFQSLSSFNRAFLKEYGRPPRAFRRQDREDARNGD